LISNVESRTMERMNELIGYSEFRVKENNKEVEKTENFTYQLSFDNVKGRFTEKGTPTMIALFIVLVLYTLMLLSYFLAERDGKILRLRDTLFKPPSINKETGEVLL